ncbi:Flp/Fap pilin component [Rosistilla ulvae]|uniref:Flp/Fap pilin component n=2 Tax=Rosistilla TaxID=2795779 RepID=A0A517M7C8_9BACT|nr:MULTISPECIES: Flp family type IVb pilin [Rosistilla]QDS90775.1 Flp/Fap pilin component [Rosistilla ulvae]QDV71235.1 Flp/Fap pilin component [Rosistilla carotiformis]
MKKFTEKVVNFLKEEDGPTAVEYAVMMALIIVVCLSTVKTIGTKANSQFTKIANNL